MDKIEISDVHEDMHKFSFGKFQVWYLKASQ